MKRFDGLGYFQELFLKVGIASARDAVEFARVKLGFEPDELQAKILAGEPNRLIVNCTRQWGKSTVIAVAALYRAVSRPGCLIVVNSPCQRQTDEFMRKLKMFVIKMGERPRRDGAYDNTIVLKNGSRIVGLPGNPDMVRSFSAASLVIIDEAARVSDDMYRTLHPMLATTDGDLWMMSTPAGQRGFFWKTWTDGDEDWMRVSVNAEECPRISKKFLAKERKDMGDYWFEQEYMCKFSDCEEALFTREMVEGALTDEREPLRL